MSDLDDRFEWVEVRNLAGEVVHRFKSACNHLTPEPVISAGELVAWLCPDCDEQFEPDYFKKVRINDGHN